MTKDVRRTGAREERGKKEWPRSGGGGREGWAEKGGMKWGGFLISLE